MENKQVELKQWDVRDDECREFIQGMIENAFCNNEKTCRAKVVKNQIITDLIRQESYKSKINEIESLLPNTKNLVDVHIVSDEIVLVEEYYKYESKNYFRPVINKKVISHVFDTFDKALIGALSYKYNCQDFAYQAITAMFNIVDND